MATKRKLPERVFERSGSWYFVQAVGKKRVWTKLCRVSKGLPVMYQALAKIIGANLAASDRMPDLTKSWLAEVSVQRSAGTHATDTQRCRLVADAFGDFRAREVTPPDVIEFLKNFVATPRTYNAYRTLVRELMRFAEEKGYRAPGSNPVDSIRTAKTQARGRYITDSELRRIKAGACYGVDGKRTRSGPMICAMIDMAYLTGQRQGDIRTLQWSQITARGILFAPAKVSGSTGVRVLIEWTERLRRLIERIRALPIRSAEYVFPTADGLRYQPSGVKTAWRRACDRAGIEDAHWHDLRAKALTDIDRLRDRRDANIMGGHATEAQTADYIRHKSVRKTAATR